MRCFRRTPDGSMATIGIFSVFAIVQVGSVFSADAWKRVTFTAGEIEDPKRNLPLLLAISIVPAIWINLSLLRYKPQFTWPGLFLVALGVLVYYALQSAAARTA